MTRSKPGEGQTRQLLAQEERLKERLKLVAARKQTARDKVTGKTRARAYCKKWLQALTDSEIKYEAGQRGINWKDLETIDAIEEAILQAMFTPRLDLLLLGFEKTEAALASADNEPLRLDLEPFLNGTGPGTEE